ncbi:hypothetical protein ATCC90586_010316 [Pythium insidiosum]|nr:hypothetical protein ATCC90586_010316 [Pythium insidiosum]
MTAAALAESGGESLLGCLSLRHLARAEAAERRLTQLKENAAAERDPSTPSSNAGSPSGSAESARLRREVARLQSRVHDLEREVASARDRPTLSSRQLHHVYQFCWMHAGGGDPQPWWQLLRACASDDPTLIPDGTAFQAYRIASSGRRPPSSPPASPSAWAVGKYGTASLDDLVAGSAKSVGSKRARSLVLDSDEEQKGEDGSDSSLR